MQGVSKTVQMQTVPYKSLEPIEQMLLQKAFAVRTNAQAPYSNYLVGVAILSEQGTVHVGCNVERCTWTQTTHAEQNAIDSMIATHGPSKIVMMAVVGAQKGTQFSLTKSQSLINNVTCGHCLQIIWENCCGDHHAKIMNLTSHGMVNVSTISDLLPFGFGPENLNISYEKTDEHHKRT